MPNSIFHIIGGLGVVMATTAAIPKHNTNDNPLRGIAKRDRHRRAGECPGRASSRFPNSHPAPKPCKPLVASGEIICDWHGVGDGSPIYNFLSRSASESRIHPSSRYAKGGAARLPRLFGLGLQEKAPPKVR